MTYKQARREQIRARADQLQTAKIKAEQFVDAGGDLNSKEAVTIGRELSLAANELSTEFGQPSTNDETSFLGTLEEISQLVVSHTGEAADTLTNIACLIKQRFRSDVCSVYL